MPLPWDDSRSSPARDRYGVPGISYPTPNIADLVVVEETAINNVQFRAIPPGTPHNKDATKRLVWIGPIKGDGTEKNQRRIYCTTRSAQDPYNGHLSYSDGNTSYPIYSRTYFLPKNNDDTAYSPATKLQPLKSLIGLVLVDGGRNYLNGRCGPIDLIFSGGGGSGATGVGEVVDGTIVAVLLKDGGNNFTSAPAVSATGGSGATITAVIQPTTCLLTTETSEAAEGEFASLFLRVTRIYETLPGPEIAETHYDSATATERTTYRQRVAIGTAANPVAAVKISSISVANPTVVTTTDPHDLPTTGTFTIRIAGMLGTTPTVDGDYTATRTGATTFTIPLNVTNSGTANTGYVSALKSTQVIIDSVVKPDEDKGAVAGTLITVCAALPGREVSAPDYDEKRAAYVDEFRQHVVRGTAARTAGDSYKGKTVEGSSCESQGSALSLLVTNTILLPGDTVSTLSFDPETSAIIKTLQTRVAITTDADTAGSLYSTSPSRYVVESRVVPENVVVGVLTTEVWTKPANRVAYIDGNEPMPSVFTYIGPWTVPGPPYAPNPPWFGEHYTITHHSPAGPRKRYFFFYVEGAEPSLGTGSPPIGSGDFPTTYSVIGTDTKIFDGLSRFTVHGSYTVTLSIGGGSYDIESADASTPSSYSSGSTLVVAVSQRRFRTAFVMQTVDTVEST